MNTNRVRFVHVGRCCFGHLQGPDADMVYGSDDVMVLHYGRWNWPSFCLQLVPRECDGLLEIT